MSAYDSKAFDEAKVSGDRSQFPDGYDADVVVVCTRDKLDGFWGPRFIAEFVNPETNEEGSMSGSLQGKSLIPTFGRVKALFAALEGIDPRDQGAVDAKVTREHVKDVQTTNKYEGRYVHVSVRYRDNKQNPNQPFVNYTFRPCLDASGKVRRV
jgi:hypothetical protein